MENKAKSLKDILEATNHPPEPDLERALLTIFGDPQIIIDARDERQRVYSAAPDFQRKKERLIEWKERIAGKGDPEEDNINRRIAEINETLATIEQTHPELVVKNTEAYTAATNEWIAWAQAMADWYRKLCDHSECCCEDMRTFERIAKRYEDNIEDFQKLCRSVEKRKTAYVTDGKNHRNDYKRMLAEFVKDVTNSIDYYHLQQENTKKDLDGIIHRLTHSAQLGQTKRRKRRRRTY